MVRFRKAFLSSEVCFCVVLRNVTLALGISRLCSSRPLWSEPFILCLSGSVSLCSGGVLLKASPAGCEGQISPSPLF